MREKDYNVDRNGIPILNKPEYKMFDFNGELYDDDEVEEMIGEEYEERDGG